jgi:protein-S-isoprenylcysteine O-methyltransferase Ste14
MTGPLLLIPATVIYAAAHSLLASLGVKDWARQRFGLVADRWYRLVYNLFAAISGLPILALLIILPDHSLYRIPFPWILLAALGQLVGVIIIVMGILQTDLWYFAGLRQVVAPDETAPPVMITTGLYAWMRHPLYTGALLLIWLLPVMTLNLLTLFVILTIYLIVGAKLEEQRLIREFGDQYREYQRRVPMLIPNLGRSHPDIYGKR